jgi:recombination protein RecA
MANKKQPAKKATEPKKEVVKQVKVAEKQGISVDRGRVDVLRLEILKKFGTNAVIMGGDHEKATYGRIRTGSIDLDLKTGGGLPVGRMTQISGAKSTSKSTICDHIVKNAQQTVVEWIWTERKVDKGREIVTEVPKKVEGLVCGYLDVEGTKTQDWTRDTVGVDTEGWLYAQPSGMEECLEMAHQMQKDGVNLIVIDSIDSLEATKAYESGFDESVQMGLKPKALGEYCRKFTATNNKLVREGKLPCTVILINQLREKIGSYGNPEYTPGGRAIEYYISVDLRLRRGDWITRGSGDNKVIVGQVVKFKTEKNKTYKQQQSGEFDFYFDETADGHHMAEIDNFKEIVIAGMEWGVIERAGAWFKYKGEMLAQGADNTVSYLKDNLDKYEQIKEELFAIVSAEADRLTKGEDEE